MTDVLEHIQINISFHDLCTAAKNKNLNMMAANKYNKIDTKNTQLMTLTTKTEQLQAQLNNNSTTLTTSGTSGVRGSSNTPTTPGLDRERIGNTIIEKWRIVKKGTSIVVDGKTYWWYPKHIDKSRQGHWIGVYVTHKPEDNDASMAKSHDNKRTPVVQTGGARGASSS